MDEKKHFVSIIIDQIQTLQICGTNALQMCGTSTGTLQRNQANRMILYILQIKIR